MKNLITSMLLVFYSLTAFTQFQKDITADQGHFADLNTVELEDSSGDYIVAGTLFDLGFSTGKLSLTRIDDVSGSVVWSKTYEDGTFNKMRGFDIIRFNDGSEKIAVTGSVNNNAVGNRALYISVFEANTGAFVVSKHYFLIGNYQNSQGLNIIHTGVTDSLSSGFVVTGFMNNEYTTDTFSNNVGFAMRVDESLEPLWTRHIDNDMLPSKDYDFVNKVIETSDGYFITGSRSKAMSTPPYEFSEVMAIKLDYYGNFVWETSYLHNNKNGIGVDAYYDELEDNIYLLANYSSNNTFGVTVINNSIGNINPASSWYGELVTPDNWYGFKISKSFDINTLVIHGYVRTNNLPDEDGDPVDVETTPFAFEFQRSNGNEIKLIQYEVLYETPSSMDDFFYFWNGDMPAVYYPDIAFRTQTADKFFSVGYRTHIEEFTKIEIIQADMNLINPCNREEYDINPNPLALFISSDTIQGMTVYDWNFQYSTTLPFYEVSTCNIAGGTGGYLTPPTSIENTNISNTSLYPNPVKNLLYLDSEKDIELVTVYNYIGEVLIKTKESKTIDIKKLQTGNYFTRIQFSDNETITMKFVKE